MIGKQHSLFEDRRQRRLELPKLLKRQDLEGDAAAPAEVECKPISLEGSLGGIDMELAHSLNQPLRPCLGHKWRQILEQRSCESNECIGAALDGLRSTGLHKPPEPRHSARQVAPVDDEGTHVIGQPFRHLA